MIRTQHRLSQLLACASLALLAAACGPAEKSSAPSAPVSTPVAAAGPTGSATAAEISALKAEIARLKAENAELRLTPAALSAEVDAAVKAGDIDKAMAPLKKLTDKYPSAPEALAATKQLEALVARKKAEQAEAQRLAALGFKALKQSPTYTADDVSIQLSSAAIAGTWAFDSYGSGYRVFEAERGTRFVTARVTVTSKSKDLKDPALFGIGVYTVDGAEMNLVGELRYRFARWDDYGSYLGNDADFRNDFAHSSSVPFSLGAQIEEDKLKRPLYLVVTSEGCHKRRTERFERPPVSYVPGECLTLRSKLTVAEFKDGHRQILKVIN